MAPRTPEQFDALRKSRRQQIMDAALEAFAAEGYEQCSISQLANYAGISKGLMYNYFKSKEELLVTIIEQGLHEIMDLFDPDRDGVLQPEELTDFIRKTFKAMRGNQQFWMLYISVILQPCVKELMANRPFITIFKRFGPMLTDYFRRMGYEDPELEMLTISAMIEGLGILLIYDYPGMELPEELIIKYEKRIIEMYTTRNNNL